MGQDSAAANEIVTRSPSDVLRLVVGVVLVLALLLVEWLFGNALVTFASDLLRGFLAIPKWIVNALAVAGRIIAVAFLVFGLALTLLRNGWRMLGTVVAAAALGAVLVPLLDGIVDVADGDLVTKLSTGLGPVTDPRFPSVVGVGVTTAVVTAAAPWLSRGWRRWAWVLVFGLAFTRFVSSPLSFDSLQAVLLGWVAGAAVLVLLGAPTRRPTADAIAEGLDRNGLPMATLEPANVDARGSTPYFGVGDDGSRYFVKALGQDERSADLLFRLFRYVQRRNLGDERPFSSLRRAVEHEAFLALAAHDVGIRTPRLRAVATAEPNAMVLAYEAVDGKSIDGLEPSALTDDVLTAIWQQIAALHKHRIAHRDLRLANIFLASDGVVWMIDFGFSELAASDLLLANDVAELVASSSVVVGPARATAHAEAVVDPDTLAFATKRLQPWALSGATRTALKEKPGLLDDLRRRLAPA
jgi:glycosyltransferase 2 family protein